MIPPPPGQHSRGSGRVDTYLRIRQRIMGVRLRFMGISNNILVSVTGINVASGCELRPGWALTVYSTGDVPLARILLIVL